MMVVLLQAGNRTALTDSGAYPAMLWQPLVLVNKKNNKLISLTN